MAKKSESDPQFEIAFFENVLKHSPNFVEALMCLGDLYTKEGFYEKGLRADEKLAELRPKDPTVFYNLACSYSLMGDLPAAKRTMKSAISYGYDDFDYLAKDPDLVTLLSDDRFQAYLKEVRGGKRKATRKRETV